MTPTLFIDRDGTLIEEPADYQIDRLHKIRLMPGVISALRTLKSAGYRFVMVTNQDGLGTASYPETAFRQVQGFVLRLFASQGIEFAEVLICPHLALDGCDCRKPKTRLVDEYLTRVPTDLDHSAVIGDRESDMDLAKGLRVPGLKISLNGFPESSWEAIAHTLISPRRTARLTRKTAETDITVALDLDTEKSITIDTGIGFFDHMLEQIACHGGFSLELNCRGDLEVDEHHTVEDTAILLGQALKEALGTKRGIARYGFLLAMDEAKAEVALDISGRAYFVFEGRFDREAVGGLPTELVPHFFRSFASALGASLHLTVRGENNHHKIESCFKGVGRALRQAIIVEGEQLPSSKGAM